MLEVLRQGKLEQGDLVNSPTTNQLARAREAPSCPSARRAVMWKEESSSRVVKISSREKRGVSLVIVRHNEKNE